MFKFILIRTVNSIFHGRVNNRLDVYHLELQMLNLITYLNGYLLPGYK